MRASSIGMKVSNLGPIEQADVVFAPLTVLTGNNNAGKTYLSQAFYAACSSINRRLVCRHLLTDAEILDLREALLRYRDNRRVGWSSSLSHTANEWINEFLNVSGMRLQKNLLNCFGINNLEHITRHGKKGSLQIELYTDLNGCSNARLFGNAETDVKSPVIVPEDTLRLDESLMNDDDLRLIETWGIMPEMKEQKRADISYAVANNIWLNFLKSINMPGAAYYLPAGRAGLLHAWNDILQTRLSAERGNFITSQPCKSSMNGINLDFVSLLTTLFGPLSGKSRLLSGESLDNENVLSVLSDLMGGEINLVSVDFGHQLEYAQRGKSMSVMDVSSMVSELASLFLWIKHFLSPGDLLIIDEPEAHVAPGSSMRLLAHALTGLVNIGVRVVCITHSYDLQKELERCLLRRKPDAENVDGRDSPEFFMLPLDMVAVYNFYLHRDKDSVDVSKIMTSKHND